MATDLDMGLDGHTPGPWLELLAAAQDALQALVGVDRLLHEHGMMSGVECPAIAPLRAAIAKARGEPVA